jgi:hypothetical protein
VADAFTFNGTALSTISVAVKQEQGLHRLASLEAPTLAIRNRDRVEPFWVARRGGTVTLAGTITGTSRSNFQANIISLKQLANPTVDANNQPTFVALTWDQRANQRLMVYTTALDVQETGPKAGEWTWELERQGYWEDSSAFTGSALTNGSVIANAGDIEVFPTWTIPFTGADTGFDFTVNGHRFDLDTSTFVNLDFLYVDSRARTVHKNAVSQIANVNTTNTTSLWPSLAPGNNTITVTTGSNYTIGFSVRRLYE